MSGWHILELGFTIALAVLLWVAFEPEEYKGPPSRR